MRSVQPAGELIWKMNESNLRSRLAVICPNRRNMPVHLRPLMAALLGTKATNESRNPSPRRTTGKDTLSGQAATGRPQAEALVRTAFPQSPFSSLHHPSMATPRPGTFSAAFSAYGAKRYRSFSIRRSSLFRAFFSLAATAAASMRGWKNQDCFLSSTPSR